MGTERSIEYYSLFSGKFVRLGRNAPDLGRSFFYFGNVKAVEDRNLLIEYKGRLISIPFEDIVSIEEVEDKYKGRRD